MDRRQSRRKSKRRQTRGAAMVEALLSYFILFLALFWMFYIFYFFVGQFFTDYAALRGARSRAVGFSKYLVNRETRINAIGGSGMLVTPRLHSSGTGISRYDATQFTMEKTLIQRYMVGATWLEYEYWFGSREKDPRLDISIRDSGTETGLDAIFRNYSFPLYTSDVRSDGNGNLFQGSSSQNRGHLFFYGVDLKGSASLGNHSSVYLED